MPPSAQKCRQMQAADHAADDEERERRSACGRSRRRPCRACRSRSRWRAACRCRTRRRRSSATARSARSRRRSPARARRPARSRRRRWRSAAGRRGSRRPGRARSSAATTAVKLNSALRNTAPSAKPRTSSAAAAGWPSSSDQRDQHRRAPAPRRSGTASRAAAARGARQCRVSAADVDHRRCPGTVETHRSRPEAERLLQIVPVACAPTGKRAVRIGGPFDHRAVVEPHIRRPSISDSTNQSVAAQCPVLQ